MNNKIKNLSENRNNVKKIVLGLVIFSFLTLSVSFVFAIPPSAPFWGVPPTPPAGTANQTPDPAGTTNQPAPAPAPQTPTKITNPLKADNIQEVILLAVDIAIYVGTAFAILAIIFVGFKFVLAQGKPEEIKKAREWFLWIIVGFAILISAKVMVTIVSNTLENAGVVKPGTLRFQN